MKRLLILLMISAFILTACANFDEKATPDESIAQLTAAPDRAAASPDSSPELEITTEAPTSPPPTLDELALSKFNRILNGELRASRTELCVEELDQYPELPSGCEAVSLTIALNSMGAKLDKCELVDDYLEYDDNFAVGFCGDPYGDGAGIYPPGLVRTAWNYINDNNARLYPFDTTGLSMDELYRFIDAGCPVVVWTTVYMNWPYFDGGTTYNDVFYPWYDLEHCVCMYGYDTDNNDIMISDPQRGKITVSASEFEEIYDEIGKFSMVIMDVSDLQ